MSRRLPAETRLLYGQGIGSRILSAAGPMLTVCGGMGRQADTDAAIMATRLPWRRGHATCFGDRDGDAHTVSTRVVEKRQAVALGP